MRRRTIATLILPALAGAAAAANASAELCGGALLDAIGAHDARRDLFGCIGAIRPASCRRLSGRHSNRTVNPAL